MLGAERLAALAHQAATVCLANARWFHTTSSAKTRENLSRSDNLRCGLAKVQIGPPRTVSSRSRMVMKTKQNLSDGGGSYSGAVR